MLTARQPIVRPWRHNGMRLVGTFLIAILAVPVAVPVANRTVRYLITPPSWPRRASASRPTTSAERIRLRDEPAPAEAGLERQVDEGNARRLRKATRRCRTISAGTGRPSMTARPCRRRISPRLIATARKRCSSTRKSCRRIPEKVRAAEQKKRDEDRRDSDRSVDDALRVYDVKMLGRETVSGYQTIRRRLRQRRTPGRRRATARSCATSRARPG